MINPEVVGGPTAWRGPELQGVTDWEHHLENSEIAELLAVGARLCGDGAPPELTSLSADDFPLPGWANTLEKVRAELVEGRGFVLIRGMPVEDISVAEAELLFWGIGLHLGVPIPQNAAGAVMVHVRDEGRRFSDPAVRAYETSERLEYHTDSGDIVGLLCLRPARRGGVSTISSGVAVHDEMVRRRPELARRLYEPWWRVSLLEGAISARPICERLGDRLYFGYGRMYLERAPQQRSEIPSLTEAQIAALDMFDELVESDDFRLDMQFEPGDIQFLNNFVILHSRTAYEDWPEPERMRDLCRLWLVRPDLELPPSFINAGIVSRSVALQGD